MFANLGKGFVLALGLLVSCATGALGGPRIVSLDECADQYVLGLAPRADIIAVSDHAALSDSFFRDRSHGLLHVRPSLEAVLALRPTVVVRTWQGDARLLAALQKFGIKVININDINTYPDARNELLRVGHELDEDASARIEAHRFDLAYDDVRDIGHGRSVLYYTPSGYSVGSDTLTGDMVRRLGFHMATKDKGPFYVSPEVVLGMTPDVFALAFYDDPYAMRRVPGRNPLVRAKIAATPHFTIPARAMLCSAWFSIYDLRDLSLKEVR
jgi:iron complex transport system substrate-binding protein